MNTQTTTTTDEIEAAPAIEPESPTGAPSASNEEMDSLRTENDSLKNLIRMRDAREVMVHRLQAAGARSPGLLFAYAVGKLQFGENGGGLENAEAVTEHLLRSFPEQFGTEAPPPINGGSGTQGRRDTITKESLAKMSAAEIAKLDWADVRRALGE